MQDAIEAVAERCNRIPEVALVLGSGLSAIADRLEQRETIPYSDIPGMPTARVAGHDGCLVMGDWQDTSVVAMQGRVHLYEGHDASAVVFGTRLMLRLGARCLIVTNAAGGIDQSFVPGDLMLITDHLNLTGANCLVGQGKDGLPMFVDMTEAYDRALQGIALRVAATQQVSLKQGVYAGLLGPSYETPAEIRMLRTLGAGAVGMSTVLEVLAARQLKRPVLGISCITNLAAGISTSPLSHQEVTDTADMVRDRFATLLGGIVVSLRGTFT